MYDRHHGGNHTKRPGQGGAPTPHETVTDETEKNTDTVSKSEKRNRTERLPCIRCFPEEKQQIQDSAQAAGLSVGEYLRRCALGRRITAKTDTKLIMELQRLGGLQKHLFNEGRGNVSEVFSKEYSEVLIAIKKAIIGIDMGIDAFADKKGKS